MEKVILSGVVMFVVGLILSIYGLPSDETELTVYTGNAMLDSFSSISHSPIVSDVISNGKISLQIIGVGSTVIGILVVVFSLISLSEGF
ncbi:MAG: hypothetical protein HZB68_03410 [Candidatus Aenigmarchaeota archaeon]|nr:hypothetical protein [Candidatus Aenigmarchaeota archaeon]